MTAFATVEELLGRLDWTLDDDEVRIAAGALEDASDMARAYGRNWEDATSAPRLVRTLVLKVCVRYLRNPSGYVTSRAGDETLGWNDSAGENAGTVYFTREEQELLAGLAGRAKGLVSIPTFAWGTRLRPELEGLVPVDYPGGKQFPLFESNTEPW